MIKKVFKIFKKKERLSFFNYSYPIKKTELTTNPPKEILFEIEPKNLKQLGPFTIETGSPAHTGPHKECLDFIIPENSLILAAAPGTVVSVVDEFEIPETDRQIGKYGLEVTKKYKGELNYIVIKHSENGHEEFSYYAHIKKGGAQVKPGQEIQLGQSIGTTGWCGWMDRPHLHFGIYNKNPKTTPIEELEGFTPQWQNLS